MWAVPDSRRARSSRSLIIERSRSESSRAASRSSDCLEVSEPMLDRLETTDGAAELEAVFGVLDGTLQEVLGGADCFCRLQHGGDLQRPLDNVDRYRAELKFAVADSRRGRGVGNQRDPVGPGRLDGRVHHRGVDMNTVCDQFDGHPRIL